MVIGRAILKISDVDAQAPDVQARSVHQGAHSVANEARWAFSDESVVNDTLYVSLRERVQCQAQVRSRANLYPDQVFDMTIKSDVGIEKATMVNAAVW